MIYFLKTVDAPFVKISNTKTLSIKEQLYLTEIYNPYDILCIRTIKDKDLKQIHIRYNSLHIKKRWFKWDDSMLSDNYDKDYILLAIESVVQKGLFPSLEELSKHYSLMSESVLEGYRPKIKELNKKYLGCVNRSLYEKYKQLYVHTKQNPDIKFSKAIKDIWNYKYAVQRAHDFKKGFAIFKNTMDTHEETQALLDFSQNFNITKKPNFHNPTEVTWIQN